MNWTVVVRNNASSRFQRVETLQSILSEHCTRFFEITGRLN